ncbi:MAG: DUF1588 domain-containing protein [Planctomycetota bacterium]
MIRWLFCLLAICLPLRQGVGSDSYIPGQPAGTDFQEFANDFLADYCIDCHSESDPEAGLSLEHLGPTDEINAATWKSVWAQVSLGEMPPEDGFEPDAVERLKFSEGVIDSLQLTMRDRGGFSEHLDPNKGNFIDHDLLFGPLPEGIRLKPTSSPARIWRLTPSEHVTRLNELINSEPEYDPSKPGQRTHGDAVPTNHGGELKLYFGTDRIIQWQGGTVAYATAVKSIPAVLSSARDHGIENYPDLYSVNSAEATQIMDAADDIIRYMIEGPLSIAEPYQITDNPRSIADKMKGDLRGLPTSIVYSKEVVRPITPVFELMNDPEFSERRLQDAVDYLFEALTFRPPNAHESKQYMAIAQRAIDQLGFKDGAVMGLSAIFLDRDALFRPELVLDGQADVHGRVMMRDWELGLAVQHALCYIAPDETLKNAIEEQGMRTREDVKREVTRILDDDRIRKPRILQFFREYFDYDRAGYLCKDNRALADTGVDIRGQNHYQAMFDGSASTDRLIELILQEDRDVLKQMLTTQQVVATKKDRIYFGERRTNKETSASLAAARKAEAEAKRIEAEKLAARKKADPDYEPTPKPKKRPERINHKVTEANLVGESVFARVGRRSFGRGSMKPERILAEAPEGQRLGVLTHPSWLVSHSDAMDNHAIHRGRWVRERLLGGGIPDVPITVDAMLPESPKETLRERMQVTREEYCWTCHQKMDPLGLPFEMYNHAGLFRRTELNKPVVTQGEIIDSGDPELDGPVADAIEMIERLAKSERVEQVFVRHAFRFWMGRNETLHDAPVLQAAHHAYRDNGGSMKALITSLLTSDAFLYRTRE